jgi:hypothetical protein
MLGFLVAEEKAPQVVRFSRWVQENEKSVMSENYQFPDRQISIPSTEHWFSFESAEGDSISLRSKDIWENQIHLRFQRLFTTPQDENAAKDLYASHLTSLCPQLMVEGDRPEARFTPEGTLFARTYSMGKSVKDPIVELHTFFIQGDYLYIISLITPMRKEMGLSLTDYSKILSKMQFRTDVIQAPHSNNILSSATDSQLGDSSSPSVAIP